MIEFASAVGLILFGLLSVVVSFMFIGMCLKEAAYQLRMLLKDN